jgi:murein DD-endopeptidase MepM/ murein hydrolase activator NlpD
MFPLDKYDYRLPISRVDLGGFGKERKFDIHTGVDLYCDDGDSVYVIESGVVVAIEQFTGFEESPWWNDTYAIIIKGDSGFILYGELRPAVIIGQVIKEGEYIGNVVRVLKEDKGITPTSMLHIELYSSYNGSVIWNHGFDRPDGLEDPSDILQRELSRVSLAYNLIKGYYGDNRAKRSGVFLINHINEGIEILRNINADQVTIDAYCLHPILQSDNDFNNNYTMDFSGISTESLLLAMEYRRVANSYLSKDNMSDFVGFTNNKIKQMLYADKKQNEKDFSLYHEGKHERSKELREYFNNWLDILLTDIESIK